MILVTGASGTIGRPLIDLLSIEGADIRTVTRNPLAVGLPADVEVVEGDPRAPTPSGSPTTPKPSGTDGKAMAS